MAERTSPLPPVFVHFLGASLIQRLIQNIPEWNEESRRKDKKNPCIRRPGEKFPLLVQTSYYKNITTRDPQCFLVDLLSFISSTFCMTTLVQTIPSCEIVIVLCVTLKSRACICTLSKGWLAIAKLKPLSLFNSLLSMLKKAFYNVKIEKWKVKVVSALQ